MLKRNCLYNCLGQSNISSIFVLLIVIVLAILPFHYLMFQYSDSAKSSEKLILGSENLKVLEKRIGIEVLVGEVLYFNSGDSIEIEFVKIGDVDCEISGKYFGVTKLDVKICLSKVHEVSPDIVVSTSQGIFSDEAYIEKNLYGKFEMDKIK
jgi:hypothetical protein